MKRFYIEEALFAVGIIASAITYISFHSANAAEIILVICMTAVFARIIWRTLF